MRRQRLVPKATSQVGQTPSGGRFNVAKGNGTLTVFAPGGPQNFSLSMQVGPSGQTVHELLNAGWKYEHIAHMVLSSQ
jgi:hypothetical protein